MTNASPGHLALVFPGQGSQYVGMGHDLYQASETARRVFAQADDVLGFPVTQLCFSGPEAELTDTINAQPAIAAVSAAFLGALRDWLGDGLAPRFVAGHSMGEYSALFAAGTLDLKSVLCLVRERGRVMKDAGIKSPGAMAAVIGMETSALRALCAEVGDVWLANDNSPGQIVVSGKTSAVEKVLGLAMERGARRAIPLAVTIASHSPLMEPAVATFGDTVNELALGPARVPVVANVTAAPITEPEDLRGEMLQQLTSPVRWVESVEYMVSQGVQTFIEVGPKNTLTRLINRIDANVSAWSVGSVEELDALKARWK